eukprot:4730051-Alexandrium_andersonii.AAC.1
MRPMTLSPSATMGSRLHVASHEGEAGPKRQTVKAKVIELGPPGMPSNWHLPVRGRPVGRVPTDPPWR